MPKRKSSTLEEEFNRLYKKIQKLEKKFRDRDDAIPSQPVDPTPDPGEEPSSRPPDDNRTSIPPLPDQSESEEEWEEVPVDEGDISLQNQEQETVQTIHNEENITDPNPSSQTVVPGTSITTADVPKVDIIDNSESTELDKDILDILGDDPASSVIYGPDIRNELASRFQHIATEGLSKEKRKELINKYPLPGNCRHVGAPKMNPEVKAALIENIIKRDKGIESKQKEVASAISCLTDIISLHLNSKDKNNQVLQKLMDVGRILCDVQHGDSITRRNFILFGVKKDMQEHLKSTKIDTSLFGENLSDTLKSAKAVNKSGADLKAQEASTSQPKKAKTSATQPLNRKAAAPPRRPVGAAPVPRNRAAPAAPRTNYQAPQPPAAAYRTSLREPPPPPRRRY